MSALGVVLDAPDLNDSPSLCHRDEPVFIHALVAKLAVEAFDVRTLVRFAGPNERQLHRVLVSPGVEHLVFELRPVIHGDGSGQSAGVGQPLQHRLDP